MSGFIKGEDRHQATLFPERLDDYIAEDSAVRVIDVFLDDLDLSGLGFKTEPNDTGRPPYHPSTLLKIYVYGYLNQVQSSRRLEREAHRNIELMWLTERLAPDQQISLTDPDARSMATSGRGTGMVGYNVQTAVDATHHLIVAHEVTNEGHDRTQLSPMAKQAKDVIGTDELDVVADRGYFKGEEILACDEAGITTYLPKPQTSSSLSRGLFSKRDFIYIPEADEYRCPADERLIYRCSTVEKGQTIHRYWSSVCPSCPIKSKCTTGNYRRVRRWEHEVVVESVQARLDREPERMRARRETAEHPFGTIKSWMGSTHFLSRGLPAVSTEMSLHVLAYNLKRMMNIFGVKPLIEAMQA